VLATANGQYPFASVLGCIDSRVVPELVLDQGIGDLFALPDDGAPRSSKNHDFVQKVAEQNVRLTIEESKRRSPVLREMAENGELLIVGAMYDIDTGRVEFLE